MPLIITPNGWKNPEDYEDLDKANALNEKAELEKDEEEFVEDEKEDDYIPDEPINI